MGPRASDSDRPNRQPGEDPRERWLGPSAAALTLAAVASLLLFHGWRRWTHVLVDFGRELYVPWRISLGETLYRDLAYFNGPLSPHLNALIFRLLGPGYMSLVLFNLALLAFSLWLVYRLLSLLADRLTATVGGVVFLVIFALADLTRAGNYNFVTPYSHEMTHGSLLGLAILGVVLSHLKKPGRFKLVSAGFLLGLVFLTKAEFLLASTPAVLMALWVDQRRRGRDLATFLSSAGWFAAASLVPPIVVWLLLSRSLPPAEALRGVLGPWPYIFLQELGELRFYRRGMGLDEPAEHLRRLLVWSGLYLAFFLPPLGVALRTPRQAPVRRWLAVASALWCGALFLWLAPRFDPSDLPRPLALILLTSLSIAVASQLGGRSTTDRWRTAGVIALNLYALLLLAKMALHPRFHNYGFALAMPAMMFFVYLVLWALPAWVDRRGGYGAAFRLSALVWLTLVALVFSWPSILVYGEKNLAFGSGRDMFRIQNRFGVIQRLLQRLPEVMGPDETLMVIPEGIMLNYQLRIENPTPHVNFMPPELIMFGEDAILAALIDDPPDVIVLVKRQTSEYGYPSIGNGYGESLMGWVAAHYPIVEAIEDPALAGASFGRALILRGPVEKTSAPSEGGAQIE